MTDKEQELVEIKKAISKILNGGQSYRIGNRTMTRADLKTLYDMQTKVENEIAESEKAAYSDETHRQRFLIEGREMLYTTKQGDTWDKIAYEQYNNEELIKTLLTANPQYIDIAVFDYGVVLEIPTISKTDDEIFLPPWRKNNEL